MAEVTLKFTNCSASDISVTFPGGRSVPIKPGMYIGDTASTGDYIITYNSKNYPVERKYINMLAPSPVYYIYITDKIKLGRQVSGSTYTCGDRVMSLDDTKAVVLSLEQNIMLTNGTSNGKWINIGANNIYIILAVVLIVFIFAVVISIYCYKKYKSKPNA
jgi:hypothetical protein